MADAFHYRVATNSTSFYCPINFYGEAVHQNSGRKLAPHLCYADLWCHWKRSIVRGRQSISTQVLMPVLLMIHIVFYIMSNFIQYFRQSWPAMYMYNVICMLTHQLLCRVRFFSATLRTLDSGVCNMKYSMYSWLNAYYYISIFLQEQQEATLDWLLLLNAFAQDTMWYTNVLSQEDYSPSGEVRPFGVLGDLSHYVIEILDLCLLLLKESAMMDK